MRVRGRHAGKPLVSFLALLVAGTGVATAQAQDPANPYATTEQQAKQNDLDTDLTPVAKESGLWTLVHGAEYPDTDVIDGSVTTFSTDLFAVSFQNRTIGLAGGSACTIEPEKQAGESDVDFGRRASRCEGTGGATLPRAPVLYRYDEPATEDPGWDRLPLPGSDKPGYIGAITWIDQDRALIVGGTGMYPRRELGPNESDQYGRSNAIEDPTDPDKADVAGEARVWVYTRSTDSARELDLSALIEEESERAGMRGLTAAACYEDPEPEPDEERIELCFAGALGQVWEWRDGSFNGRRIDASSPEGTLQDAHLFRHRVRDITFVGLDPPAAAAVTAGCCAPDPLENTPRVLVYDHATCQGSSGCERTGPPRWYTRRLQRRQTQAADTASPETKDDRERIRDAPHWPDSLYSVMPSPSRGSFISAIGTAGGPESANEKPSVLTGPYGVSLHEPGLIPTWSFDEEKRPIHTTSISTARLVDGDGDVGCTDPMRPSGGFTRGLLPELEQCSGGDEFQDWAVGQLRSAERAGLGRRGLVVATHLAPRAIDAVDVPVVNPESSVPTAEEVVRGEWEPANLEKVDRYRRSQHHLLPSYAANAIDVVGQEEDGWIVGDRGAILRLSANAVNATAGASEPNPPELGARREARLSNRAPYAPAADSAVTHAAGEVPGISAETVEVAEPRMVHHAALRRNVRQIVMSRDGSEGWAIGTHPDGGPAFLHYDGGRWEECDPVGLQGVVEPDPACEAMAPLRGYRDRSGVRRTVSLTHMVRIPLENDSDPTNDDELEILALAGGNAGISSSYTGPEYGGETSRAVVRFRNGRWSFEQISAVRPLGDIDGEIIDVAFTAPNEGWLVANVDPTSAAGYFRFDGDRWIDCASASEGCADEDGRLPENDTEPRGLAVAGERVFLYGSRQVGPNCVVSGVCPNRGVPLILYRDPGGEWTDGSGPGEDAGGFDPAFADPATEDAGVIHSLSVVERPSGGFEGWAVGMFFTGSEDSGAPDAVLMRLDPEMGDGWRRFHSPGAFEDYMPTPPLLFSRLSPFTAPGKATDRLHVAYPSEVEPDGTFIGERTPSLGTGSHTFGFDSRRGRFGLLDSGRPTGGDELQLLGRAHPLGTLQAMAPDGHGGFWAAISGHIFRYTDRLPREVFEEVSNPFGVDGVDLRAIDGGPDGSVWLATNSDRVYRYDRVTGWEEARIPGWDPGRVITRASEASAIAVGPDGEGIVVGEGGRIADVSASSVSLNPAAGRSCALGDPPPCGSSRDLRAVDIAPDGSAIAAGERMSVLWRPPGGGFRSVPRPAFPSSTRIDAVSLPTPDRAYLATNAGVIFRGEMSAPGQWRWQKDNAGPDGEVVTVDADGEALAIRDIAIDSDGHGYAVGDAILERSRSGGWSRLPTRLEGNVVELPETGGEGFLIGTKEGQILTGNGGELRIARHEAFHRAVAPVLGFAYLPGTDAGSVDAWAAIGKSTGRDGVSRLLRFRSDRDDALLDPALATAPIPDAPTVLEQELSIGAFGKSDCDRPEANLCPEMSATTTTNELLTERAIDELVQRRRSGDLDLAILTGDATDSAGQIGASFGDYDRRPTVSPSHTQSAGQLKHRRYGELVADELEDKGLPFLGAIGGQDLSEAFACETNGRCETTKRVGNAGENLAWREAFAGRMEPWGSGEDELDLDADEGDAEPEYEFIAVRGSDDGSVRIEDQKADADGEGPAPEAKAEIGGANTHYAVEAIRDGERVARIVFVDTSMKSLAASDPLQQPQELAGGQQRFLERMICTEGDTTSTGDECTRAKDQAAIVVSNTPTYSYGPGALTHTATDANVFEALVLKHDVDLVISGALGYNGLYYTLAPGVHEPCPGGEHPEGPPKGGLPSCAGGADGLTAPLEQNGLSDHRKLLEEQGFSGTVPTVIASGAGGKFGPDGQQSADGPAGQWHGYSVARLRPDGEVIVEQRPILDWIGMDAADHTVDARSRLKLNGYGRSPISTTVENGSFAEGHGTRAFHYDISNAAITHRYDLLLADPDRPWLPCEADDADCEALHAKLSVAPGEPVPTSKLASAEKPANAAAAEPDASSQANSPCAPYLCLPERIATVDRLSGEVKAKDGKYPETFAIAMLSVGDKVASYPLVFKPSPSFVVTPFEGPPSIPANASPAAQTPPSLPKPQIPSLTLPTPPTLPAIPPLVAATPPEPAPPAPPVPPPPSEQPSPLNLSVAPTGLTVATPTAVIQPPTPPVNPAPPGGARREARQRQAAAQKSGADSDQSEGSDAGVDTAEGPLSPTGSGMSRHEPAEARRRAREKPQPSFTPISRESASPWGTGALYGGGITLMAFALAAGWTRGRPTPRRRQPNLAAPATSRTYSDRNRPFGG